MENCNNTTTINNNFPQIIPTAIVKAETVVAMKDTVTRLKSFLDGYEARWDGRDETPGPISGLRRYVNDLEKLIYSYEPLEGDVCCYCHTAKVKSFLIRDDVFVAKCPSCKASGPWRQTAHEALEAWGYISGLVQIGLNGPQTAKAADA